MKWHMVRRGILGVYGAGFLLLAFLLAYAALTGGRLDGSWPFILAALLLTAEGVGLILFLPIARLGLKAALVLGGWFALRSVMEYGAWNAMAVPVGFAGLLLLEIGFIPVDRKIAEERRARAESR